jgi:hypothetical protein
MTNWISKRFFADILLTPLEATRIRLVSQKGYADNLMTGFARLAREGGLREMYAGFVPILFKYVYRLATFLLGGTNTLTGKYPMQLASSLLMNSAMSLYIEIYRRRTP